MSPDHVFLAVVRAIILAPPSDGRSDLARLLAVLCALCAQAAGLPDPVPGRVAAVLAALPPWVAHLPAAQLPPLSPAVLVSQLRTLTTALDWAARGQGWWRATGWAVELLVVEIGEVAAGKAAA